MSQQHEFAIYVGGMLNTRLSLSEAADSTPELILRWQSAPTHHLRAGLCLCLAVPVNFRGDRDMTDSVCCETVLQVLFGLLPLLQGGPNWHADMKRSKDYPVG